METPLLKDIVAQLLKAPVNPSGTLADVVTYIRTLLAIIRRLVNGEKDNETESTLLEVVKACYKCMIETTAEAAEQIAPVLATSLTMLKPYIATTTENTRSEMLKLVPLVMAKSTELIEVVLVAVSAVIQCGGAEKPELLKPVVQALPQLSKKYQQYVLMVVCVDTY